MKDRTTSSTHGRRIASKTLSNQYTSSKPSYRRKSSSFIHDLCGNTNTRILCTVIIAIFLILSLLFMLYVDNESHSHFTSNQNTQQQLPTDNNLISIQELNTMNYINTARTRNIIPSKTLRPLIENTKDDIHIIFSTGCSEYQNWQSEVLLYSWARLNHPGQITRIVSGCKNLDDKKSALKTAIVSERVHLFYAPDYTPPQQGAGRPFHYFNKPFSMRKFVNEVDIAESILVLIDPDMIITKVFNYHLPDVGAQYQVKKGHPVSQKYGIGAKWVPWKLCKTAPCLQVDDRIAWKHYSVGPPYMMHIDDWRLIVDEWVDYSPAALEKDPPPSILAEMYSYAMACAHHDLPHELVQTMLSDPDSMISEPRWTNISWEFKKRGFLKGNIEELHVHILHYCHGYWLGDERNTGHMANYGFNFHKGHLPKDILHNCERSLLVEPPTNKFAMDRDSTKNNNHVWMLYQLITRINNALANYKQLYCGESWVPTFNTVLRQPEADSTNKMHYFLDDLFNVA